MLAARDAARGSVDSRSAKNAARALGPRHRLLLPASVLAGAIVLVVADLLARIVLAPVEIPVGIVTALAGGPFFLWILLRKERAR